MECDCGNNVSYNLLSSAQNLKYYDFLKDIVKRNIIIYVAVK